jgi:tetratricopeptide (TPR) repeat protein
MPLSNTVFSPWNTLLSNVKLLMQDRRGQQPPSIKVSIVYAWEDDDTPLEGKDGNAKLQRWLERLRDDLQLAGISVSLDIGDMHGQMPGVAGSAARASHFPAFSKVRMQQNLHVILTITEAITDKMKGYAIRDCHQEENYEHALAATQKPFGIIPAIYGLDCDDDLDYRALIQQWRCQKLTRLPPVNPDFVGRETLLTQLTEALQQGESAISQRQTISGLGGVGKTELALAFAHQEAAHYTMLRWLNAEGNNLFLEFTQMAVELDIESQGMDVQELTTAVYARLAVLPTWLLVLDNADDYAAVKAYLPTQAKAGQHVLITSRSQQWRNIVTVDSFSAEETLACVQKQLPLASPQDAQALGKAVNYLPLALSQAVAYIHQNKPISILSYLTLYEEKGIALLQPSDLEDEAQRYPKSVLTTLTLSIEKVTSRSPKATELLMLCAYLAPDNLPLALFEQEDLLKDTIVVQKAVRVLRDYSLVEPAKLADHLQIHRLVQAVLQQQVQNQKTPEQMSTRLITLRAGLEAYYPWDKIKLSDYDKARVLLPHFEVVIGHLEPLVKVVAEEENTAALAQVTLLGLAGDALGALGDAKGSKTYYERALAITERHYGPEHPNVATTLMNLGNALGALGDAEGSKTYYERALAIKECHYGPEHPNVASTLNNLSVAEETLGNMPKALLLAQRAAKILKQAAGYEQQRVKFQTRAEKLRKQVETFLLVPPLSQNPATVFGRSAETSRPPTRPPQPASPVEEKKSCTLQ